MNINRQTSGPKSFGTQPRKSFFDGGDRSIPGPGAHSPEKFSKIQNPEWGIGTSVGRNSFMDSYKFQYPSPQDYKPHLASIEKNPIKYSIPQGSLALKPNQSYNPIYNISLEPVGSHQPSFSFGYALETNYNTEVPGPGSYQQQNSLSSFNKTHNHFGLSQRPQPFGEQGKFPGPGKYLTLQLERRIKYSFGKADRKKQLDKDPIGKFYDIGPKKKGPKGNRIYDIKSKKRQTMLYLHNQNPAPNQYETFLPVKIPNGVIEHSKRHSLENADILKYPSPDKYSVHQDIRQKKKGITFGKSTRSFSLTENFVPPPGNYEPMNTFCTIGGAIGKYEDKTEASPTPSCCQYRPKLKLTKLKAQSTIVFKGNRVDFSKTMTGQVGPGQYSIETISHSGQLGKIGKGQRSELYYGNKNPGVGNYDIPTYFGRLPKYYSSPKKVNPDGYSTFHEKMRFKIQQKQRNKQLEKKQEELSEEVTPSIE